MSKKLFSCTNTAYCEWPNMNLTSILTELIMQCRRISSFLESFHETKQNPTPLFKACLMPKTLLEKTDDQLSKWLIAMHWTQSSPWTPCPWSPGSLPMMSKICEFRISVFPKCRTEWTCRRPTWHCLLARALALAKPEAQTGSLEQAAGTDRPPNRTDTRRPLF